MTPALGPSGPSFLLPIGAKPRKSPYWLDRFGCPYAERLSRNSRPLQRDGSCPPHITAAIAALGHALGNLGGSPWSVASARATSGPQHVRSLGTAPLGRHSNFGQER